ncbi:MAG: hypothetical protein R3B72_21205 [Polyangiaceae bacterium]
MSYGRGVARERRRPIVADEVQRLRFRTHAGTSIAATDAVAPCVGSYGFLEPAQSQALQKGRSSQPHA